MAGPTSPSSEGPTFGPPQLPPGWIAQWDGASKKYYFVQLSTGVSQWEVPTDAAPTGSTPAPIAGDHPYGVPRQQELITHPDGSQTVRHADGSLEPVNPPMPPDGTRGLGDGPAGDRGLGSMAMNALLGGKNTGGGGSSQLGGLASQFLGGGSNNHGGGGSGLGKIGGALASSFLSSSSKPDQPQNFHGGNSSASHQQSHGLAGSIMGGVANMFGGGKQNHGGSDFGYTNTGGGGGGYTGQAPPTSYQPSGQTPTGIGGSGSSYQPTQQHQQQSFAPPPVQTAGNHKPAHDHQPSGHQAHPTYGQVPPPPAGGPPSSSYGHSPNYSAPPQQQNQLPQYGGSYNPSSYGGGPAGGHPGSHTTYSNGPSQHSQGPYGTRY